jgi:hypothetical protein
MYSAYLDERLSSCFGVISNSMHNNSATSGLITLNSIKKNTLLHIVTKRKPLKIAPSILQQTLLKLHLLKIGAVGVNKWLEHSPLPVLAWVLILRYLPFSLF